jgi:hypothetical protein
MMRRSCSPVLVVLLFGGIPTACSNKPASAGNAAQSAARGPQSSATAGSSGDAQKSDTPIALGTLGPMDLIADYERECVAPQTTSAHCEALRSVLVIETAMALEAIERSRDQRGVEEALAALDLRDEPEIIVAAGRVLGRFPDTPGVGARMLPFVLESPYVEVQRVAAQLLKAGPDPALEEVGSIWLENHKLLPNDAAYQEYPDFPGHYASLGFPKYPGAEWFSPADSDRSVGWSTKDSVATVSRWFADSLKSPIVGAEQWNSERVASTSQAIDPSKMARMQQLAERAGKGDQTVVAEIEKLTKEAQDRAQNYERAQEKSVDNVANPPFTATADARWIVAQRKDGHVSRVVLVYPVRALQRTAIQLVWNLGDHPSAWPIRSDAPGN